MSIRVYAIQPADEKWFKMKEIWDKCKEMDIYPPKEVEQYFDLEYPDSDGKLIDITEQEYVKEYTAEMVDGYEIDISKLPKNTKLIRVAYYY